MTESATRLPGRRSSTTWRISRSAQLLTDQLGLDGFTMDELAVEAGVSRRTLFNHFPGKVDAVLGPPSAPTAEALETFRTGGPTGVLLLDLRELANTILDSDELGREDLARIRRLLTSEPKLLAATHDRFLRLSELIVQETERREGPAFGRQRARVAVAVLAALFDTALDAFLADDRHPLTHHFDTSIGYARALFG